MNIKIKFKFTIILALIAIIITGCVKTKEIEKYSVRLIEDHMFDTVVQFILYTDDENEFNSYVEIIKNRFEYYHKLYDKYNEYEDINNIKTINKNAGLEPVKVNQEIIDLLSFSLNLYDETYQKNNIAMGPVLEVWHDYREMYSDPFEYPSDNTESKLPPLELLESKAKFTNIKDIIIDDVNNTVLLNNENMSIDVGGVAKGYATERIVKELEESGLDNFVISAGGNVRAVGYSRDANGKEKLWNTGITNPFDPSSESIGNVHVTGKSVVSSGDYQRFYWYNNQRYSHIIDPATLYPGTNYAQVSICVEDSGLADYLSTEIFLLPYEEGLELAKKFNAEVLWVFMDGETRATSDFFNTNK